MKCPLKPIKSFENRYGELCNGSKDNSSSTIAKVKTDFGDCDMRNCMAYIPNTGKCRMMNEKGG